MPTRRPKESTYFNAVDLSFKGHRAHMRDRVKVIDGEHKGKRGVVVGLFFPRTLHLGKPMQGVWVLLDEVKGESGQVGGGVSAG